MRPSDQKMLDEARRLVDLSGYLAHQGWTVGDSDCNRWRQMDGPGGQRLLVRHIPKTAEWVWAEAHDRERWHTIYHLVQYVQGGSHGQILAAVRRARNAPPPAPALGHGGRISTVPGTRQPKPPRSLPALDEPSTAYLTGERWLHPDTVAAFAHELRSLPGGTVVAIHNRHGDGEQKGPSPSGAARTTAWRAGAACGWRRPTTRACPSR